MRGRGGEGERRGRETREDRIGVVGRIRGCRERKGDKKRGDYNQAERNERRGRGRAREQSRHKGSTEDASRYLTNNKEQQTQQRQTDRQQ